ncbi:MAG: putative endonuclease [Candidatus Azotimanducaceae bacterium]
MHSTRRQGQEAEQLACTYLEHRGLQLITKNFACKTGEIDLILHDRSAIQRHILVLVEVRSRNTMRFGGAAASVTPAKQRRLQRTALYFCKRFRIYAEWPMRFDVVAIDGLPDKRQISWLKAAFEC